MHITDFDYELPAELIAREPLRPRDTSRMLVLDRQTGAFIDSRFNKLAEFLRPDDVLVINDTRVMKARVYAVVERTNKEVEVFFANPIDKQTWEVLVKPGKRVRPGDRVPFGVFGELLEHGLRVLKVEDEDVESLLEREGHVPLPPYIERSDTDSDLIEYQTMFAANIGAVAAPTAGLHFTPEVCDAIRRKGIDVVSITLHVGVGTFMPVREEDPRRHYLKPERFTIAEDTARRLNIAKRVIAVGTTTTRTLEYVARQHGRIEAGSGETDLYILPGYEFQVVDGLLTNFHLPRSTLLMLVSAFASRDRVLRAYAHAVAEKYRFYSYGDCMLILHNTLS
jgi:S-adenosylmethionine:tRNA ribosyltransferase-isomerase